MSAKDDGGPAYPVLKDLEAHGMGNGSSLNPVYRGEGLTVRDAFAIATLQGVIEVMMKGQAVRAADLLNGAEEIPEDRIGFATKTAKFCFGMADAMLEARKR